MSLALAVVAAAQAKVGDPTGDLIVVPKTEEFILGETRQFDFQAIGRGLGSRVVNSLAGGRILVVRPPKGRDWRSYRQELLSNGVYESVEPDTWASPTALSNDPSLTQQQHLFQISAPRAWDFSNGSTAPILAVVDGGVELNHPDLVDNLVSGYNTITGLAQSAGGVVSDVTSSGHGTRVAGIAAARGNNGVGVSGVGWNLRLMPIRATDQVNGTTARSELIEGATWAIQNGAKVVNVSYTEVQFNDVDTLGALARAQGALVVWSAGNTKTNWANFDHANVTVVGGVDASDNVWSSSATLGSGYGKGVDCFAPVTGVFTTRKGSPAYGLAPAGVSFAVPQVAATLAMMMGREPTLPPAEIERRMLLRCANMGPLGNDINFGYGRLNAGAAVEWPIRKYSLQSLPTLGIPGAARTYPWNIVDEGTVYGIVERSGLPPVLARWKNGALLGWISSDAIMPGAAEAYIYDVNEAGTVVGSVVVAGRYRGFRWNLTSGASLMPDIGYTSSYLLGINNSDVSVGRYYEPEYRGVLRDLNGNYSSPLTEPPISTSASHSFEGILEDGTIIGLMGSPSGSPPLTPFFYRPETGIVYTQPSPHTKGGILDFTEEGAFVMAGYSNIGLPYVIHALAYNSRGVLVADFGVNTHPEGCNENFEVIGVNKDGFANTVGARIFQGYSPGLLVDQLAPLPNDPNNTIPPNIASLDACYDINNLGQITVRARGTNGNSFGFIANPVDTPGLGMSLGQIGANPTYIGSIPPVLSVTYCNDAGVPYPNGTVTNDYRGDVGLMNISPPPSVTGSYRMYLRCNGTAIPGYDGPKFLSRMIPPLNLPPAPRDSFYLPFQGATSNTGTQQPVIELYPGDIDESGEIDAADIDIVIANFGSVLGGPGWDGGSDVDGSGEIDAADIDVVIANFGLTDDPEP